MKKLLEGVRAAGGIVVALLGLLLAGGGAYLITLGGSFFYLPAGVALIAVGIGALRRAAWSVYLMLALLAVTMAWSLWEVGFDFWQLMPRLVVFLAIAIGVTAISPLLLRADGSAALPAKAAAGTSGFLAVVFAGFLIGMFVPHFEVSPDGTAAAVTAPGAGQDQGDDWPNWGRDKGGNKYAQFAQINRDTVKNLKVAWTFRTGDMAINGAEYQVTPLKIGDTMYLCTPHNQIFALDPATGKQRWVFKPDLRPGAGGGDGGKGWQRCRGVAYAETPSATAGEPCQTRILTTTIDAKIWAVDARTGLRCPGFGDAGSDHVDLLRGLGPKALGNYFPTSAPLVARDVLVVGGLIGDNDHTGQPSGVVRAFDLRTGKIRWAWDPANPKRGTPLPDGQDYPLESPNFWGTASFDPKLNLIYIPTGNQTPDFWNGNRHPYSDEYNDSIVAIDASTGIDKWHFRTTNHDMYDYDLTSQPILYDMPDGKGGTTPVLIELSKRGQIFVLDRRTGQPVVPVTNRPVPTDAMPGMKPSPVQPFSALSVGVDPLTEKDAWGGTIFDQLYCRIQYRSFHWEGPFTPFKENQWTLMWPGYYGGFNWGGGAVDPTTGTLYVNDIRMAMIGRFLQRDKAAKAGLKPSNEGEYSKQDGTPYGAERAMWLSPLGFPCFKPPYGSMTAIDLKTLKKRWTAPLGTIADAPVHGITPHIPLPLGMPTLGGPLVTKGGLVFFHGTLDWYLRAMDSDSGKVLWKSRLPVGGQGVPMTYVENGKQYVVVVVGGATRTGTNRDRGDYVIAYALS